MSFELADVYTADYDEAVKQYFPPFPRGLAGKYYEEGLNYFIRFDGFGDGYEILAVEERFEIRLRGNVFVGVADLILRKRETGEIIVIDHKSKSFNSLNRELKGNKRQLYLYAAYVREKYGVYPSLLRFNMFRYNDWVDEPFDPAAYDEMLDWTEQTIAQIRADQAWLVSSSGYFCRWICSARLHCPVGDEIIHSHERRVPE